MSLRVTKHTQQEYETLLLEKGEEAFYRYILGNGIIQRIDYAYPEVMLLDKSEAFFALYRNTGNNNYFTIGKILRKAAHKLYRQFKHCRDEDLVGTRFLRSVNK